MCPVAAFALSVVLCSACTPRDAAAPAPPTSAAVEEPTPRDRTFDPVSVQFHVVGEIPLAPPRVELLVDIVVLNHASEARWVLLPREAGVRPLERGGVEAFEVERWGDVVVGSWLGAGGFRAVRVAPDGHVQLRGVPVQWTRVGDEPAAWLSLGVGGAPLEALACRELLVDGHRAATWFDREPSHAEVAVELLEPIEVRYVPWPRD